MTGRRGRDIEGARILVVEDNEDFRLLLELTLTDEGFRVDCAESSEEAVRLLDAFHYDLVLSDYCLPGHSGAWLLSHAKSKNPPHGIPCLIVTGDPDAPGIPDRTRVVRKPVDFERLLARIRGTIANTTAPVPADADANRAFRGVVQRLSYRSAGDEPSSSSL